MPAERLSMRKVREVLRLTYACGMSARLVARSLGIGRTVVGEYIRRAQAIGLTWPVPTDLDDATLERKLFAPAGYNPPRAKPLPDWGGIHAELRGRGVTLALLWQEYLTPPSPSICRVRIGATPSGPRRAYSMPPRRSVTPPLRCAR
jgi:hypothetical protein